MAPSDRDREKDLLRRIGMLQRDLAEGIGASHMRHEEYDRQTEGLKRRLNEIAAEAATLKGRFEERARTDDTQTHVKGLAKLEERFSAGENRLDEVVARLALVEDAVDVRTLKRSGNTARLGGLIAVIISVVSAIAQALPSLLEK